MTKIIPVFVLLSILSIQNSYAQNVGNPAPDFEVNLAAGGTFKLSDNIGKVIFVFMFGNTCPSCIAAGPSVESNINQQFVGDPNYVAVGLDIWDGSTAKVNAFGVLTGITFPLAKNSSFVASNYNSTYDRLMVIDADGILQHKGVIGAGSDINNARMAVQAGLAAIVTDPCETAEINISEVIADPTCSGETNGSIDLTISGTYPGFSALWSNGATDQDISGLGAGTYSVTVTDNEGCTFMEEFSLSNPPSLVVDGNSYDPECAGGNTGSVAIQISGGTGPYDILWSTGSTSDSIFELIDGCYIVEVTDAIGCVVTDEFCLIEPPELNANLNISHNSCFGEAEGSVTVQIEGGTPPYHTFHMGTEFDQDLDNLLAGTYEILVTDANQCTLTVQAIITEPADLVIEEINGNEEVQAFQNYKYAIPNPTGLPWENTEFVWQVQGGSILRGQGSAMIDVQWGSGESGWVEAYAMNLTECTSDTIRLLVSISDTTMVTDTCQMAGIEISHTLIHPSCSGASDGSIEVLVSGNYPGFALLWSNEMKGTLISGLDGGSYIVTVTDTMGCMVFKEYMLNEPLQLEVSEVVYPPTCPDDSSGSVRIGITGGTGPYSILWSTGATADSISGLLEGCYTVEITDAAGCTVTHEVCIDATEKIVLMEIDGIEMAEALQTYTYIVASVMDVSYMWTATGGTIISGQGTATVEVTWELVGSGRLEVIALNSSGCMSDSVSKEVSVSMATSLNQKENSVIQIYPNPASNVLYISSDKPFEITLYSLQGSRLLISQDQQIDISFLSSGSYLVSLRTTVVSRTIHLIKQ